MLAWTLCFHSSFHESHVLSVNGSSFCEWSKKRTQAMDHWHRTIFCCSMCIMTSLSSPLTFLFSFPWQTLLKLIWEVKRRRKSSSDLCLLPWMSLSHSEITKWNADNVSLSFFSSIKQKCLLVSLGNLFAVMLPDQHIIVGQVCCQLETQCRRILMKKTLIQSLSILLWTSVCYDNFKNS